MKTNSEFNSERREAPRLERYKHLVNSEEEAIALVKEFWQAMPHGDALTFPGDEKGWMAELTAGDRTKIAPGKFRGETGKWVVTFQGNHQDLTKEAVEWLMKKGFVC
jgi:hypothetical protein